MSNQFLKKRQEFKTQIMRRFGISESVYTKTTRLLAPIAETIRFRKGEYLQQAGVPAQALYWLTGGVARIGFTAAVGEEVTIRFAMEGESASSHDLLMASSGVPAVYYIVAESPVEAFRMDWAQLCRIRAEHSEAEKYHLKVLEHYVKWHALKSHANLATSARDRLAAFRADYPGLESRVSQKAIASYLGITPQYLSQMLRQDRADG